MALRREELRAQRIPAPTTETDRVAVRYIFSSFVRASHWLRSLMIVWFVVSGFYLASPFLARNAGLETTFNFVQTEVRAWHIVAGWALIGLTLGRVYVFFLRRAGGTGLGLGDEFRMSRVLLDPRAWREQLGYYLLARRAHPGQSYSHYGPLQYLVYVGFYAAIVLMIVTGVALAGPYQGRGLMGTLAGWIAPFTALLGGLGPVRQWHHLGMWAIILFTVLHLYMVAWNAVRGRSLEMESIVSGYRADHSER